MSTDDQIDRGMEQTLRDYFAARSRELEAPRIPGRAWSAAWSRRGGSTGLEETCGKY